VSSPSRWKLLSNETLQDCVVFSVARSLVESPSTGQPHPFYRIDASDWVNVVPVTPDGQIVMVRQYRHGLRDVTLEIPGGIVDPGEEPREAAARELLEETGYAATSVEPLGSVNPNPALFGNRVYSFVAHDVRQVSEIRNSATEETVVELVPRVELTVRLASGEIDHALVVTALYWYELELRSASR